MATAANTVNGIVKATGAKVSRDTQTIFTLAFAADCRKIGESAARCNLRSALVARTAQRVARLTAAL